MADGPTHSTTRARDLGERAAPGLLALAARRIRAMSLHGWDINGLCLLHEDAQALAPLRDRLDADASVFDAIDALHGVTGACLEAPRLPDPAERSRIAELAAALAVDLPLPASVQAGTQAIGDASRIESPPAHYWRQWADDAPPPVAVSRNPDQPEAEPEAVFEHEPSPRRIDSDQDVVAAEMAAAQAAGDAFLAGQVPADLVEAEETSDSSPITILSSDRALAPDAELEPTPAQAARRPPAPDAEPPAAPPAGAPPAPAGVPAPEATGPIETPRVYHLTDGDGLGCEIDQAMEAAGWEAEILNDAEELEELLAALPPDLVVIDAAFAEHLESIGAVLRATRQRTGVRIPLAALAESDDLALRLSARRAGVDALLIDPDGADAVLERLRALLTPPAEAPFRVMIVEDDASQALFAESILRNAGMDTEVVDDPFDVMPALERFEPDMVLMDLHMPRCNGMELTSLIRDEDRFLNLPIVFLSGESDQDTQFQALDAGGDDFIAKPVRPRHLIAAVQNRIRRSRALALREQAAHASGSAGPAQGSTDRASVMVQAHLRLEAARHLPETAGGALFLEVEGGAQLRERLGLSTLEQLLAQAATVIESRLGPHGLLSRFGDGSFLALVSQGSDEALLQTAQGLRHALAAYAFEADDRPLRLRFSVGACSLRHDFADTGELLNAVERASRRARASERGVEIYEPPQNPDAAREAALLQRIRDGIAGQGFELVYQPIVAVQGGEDAQYQTLLRMREADGRLMPAGELIPVADRAGLMREVDRWVLDAALGMIAESRGQSRSVRLFVPQSILTLTDPDQPAWLAERLASTNTAGSSLVIELRCDDAVVHRAALEGFCHAMADAGVGLCLSRFELGSNSRSLMEALPLSFIKLAGKYLEANTAQDVRDELRVLIDEAHRNNLQVIGHRVEDAQSAATLWMSGIDFIQGNLVQHADATTSFDFQSAVL